MWQISFVTVLLNKIDYFEHSQQILLKTTSKNNLKKIINFRFLNVYVILTNYKQKAYLKGDELGGMVKMDKSEEIGITRWDLTT